MIRYGDVTATRCAACTSPGDRAATAAVALAGPGAGVVAGALFVRSYERGERVYLAMESRGYAGRCRCASAAATLGRGRGAWLLAGAPRPSSPRRRGGLQ